MGINNNDRNSMRTWRSLLLCLVVLSLLLSGCGGQQTKVYRVGILSGFDLLAGSADGFKEKMTELGYVEGKNITYDLQKTNFDPPTEEKMLQKFVDDKVDLIFSFPTEVSLFAKAATEGTDIPVVFANAAVEGVDLIESVREPGGNITGVRWPTPDIALRRLEILIEIAPETRRILVPYFRDYPNVPPQLEVLRPAAAAAGITLLEAPVSSPPELQAELDAQTASDPIDAILLLSEPVSGMSDFIAVFGKFAADHKIPFCGATLSVGDYHPMCGVMVDPVDVGKQAALLADKVLKGTKAGTIPVASAEQYLMVNYKVAQELGLKVPDGVLSMANEVIR